VAAALRGRSSAGLLASTEPFDAGSLRNAIDETFRFRKTHAVPTSPPPAPMSWTPVYACMANNDGLTWQDLDAVTDAARAFLDPVLRSPEGTWDAAAWRWSR
jgi:hypothetical protein